MNFKSTLITEHFNLDLEIKTVDSLSHSKVSKIQNDVQFVVDQGKFYMLNLLRNLEREKAEVLRNVGR